MSEFHGGPANGISLMHARAPLYLRVVQGMSGFDVLDLLEDEPGDHETIHVYRRREREGGIVTAHINARGSKLRTGFYSFADYDYVPVEPEVCETLRDRETWQQWAVAQPQ